MRDDDSYFIQVTDPQFGMYYPGTDDFEESDLVALAIARANALRPAFVLCTGDIIDTPCSDRQILHARQLLGGLDEDIPFIALPGNHDIGDSPTPKSLAWFRRNVGRDRVSFNHRGWHFVGLNSCLLATGDQVVEETERQWRWLENDLQRAASGKTEGIIAFMHHPLFLRKAGEEDDYFNLPRTSRDRCVELFRRYGVDTVLSGHLHQCHDAEWGNLKVVVSGPVGMPLGDGFSGLRIVRFGPGGVHHHYFALDDVVGQEAYLERRRVG